jgi:response regulator RpfG family c-di-GMP phosphodiesterase
MVKRVFIIDDDPISILVTETLMRKNEFAEEIKTFEEPDLALNFFRNEYDWSAGSPDYIFLDVQMPNTDAWKFLDIYIGLHESIREKDHVILLSATFNPEDEDKARNHPMVIELITKPVNASILQRLK